MPSPVRMVVTNPDFLNPPGLAAGPARTAAPAASDTDMPILRTLLEIEDLRPAAMFKALGNPTRLAILRWLAAQPSCITADVVAAAGLAQSTVSGHLAVLREAGLFRCYSEGPATCYCLDQQALDWFQARVTALVHGVGAEMNARDHGTVIGRGDSGALPDTTAVDECALQGESCGSGTAACPQCS